MNRRTHRASCWAAAAVALVCLGALPAAAGEIALTDDGFSPETVTVAPGETILWTNATDEEYTIVGPEGAWDSGPLAPGTSFSIGLRQEGEFSYSTSDGSHGGTILVTAAQPAPAEEPAVDPVVPRTGLPAGVLAVLALALLGGGAGLIIRART